MKEIKLQARAPNRGIVYWKGKYDLVEFSDFDKALEILRKEMDRIGGNLVVCANFIDKCMCVVDGAETQPGAVLNSVLEMLNGRSEE